MHSPMLKLYPFSHVTRRIHLCDVSLVSKWPKKYTRYGYREFHLKAVSRTLERQRQSSPCFFDSFACWSRKM